MNGLVNIINDTRSSSKQDRDESLEILLDLTSAQNYENRISLRELGVVQALLEVISPKDPQTIDQESCLIALKVLLNLTIPVENHLVLVHDYEVLPHIISTLDQHTKTRLDDHSVTCLMCLVNLSLAPKNRSLICGCGACALLVRALKADFSGDGRMWAIWTLTNLSVSEECFNDLLNNGVIDALAKIVDTSRGGDPRSVGILALRNLAKHQTAVYPLVYAGVVEIAVRLVRSGTFEQNTNTSEGCAVTLLLRLSEHDDLRHDMLAKGTLQAMGPILAKSSFLAMQAYITHVFLTNFYDQDVPDEYLIPSSPALQRLTELLKATVDRTGVSDLYDYGLFSLETVCKAFRCTACIPANKARLAGQTGCVYDLVNVVREQSSSVIAVENALEALVELSTEITVKSLLASDLGATIQFRRIRDSHASQKAQALAENLLFIIESGVSAKYLFFSCEQDTTTAVVCRPARSLKDLPSIQSFGLPAPCLLDFLPQVEGTQKDFLSYALEVILHTRPTSVVLGIPSWFQTLEKETQQQCMNMLEKTRIQITHVVLNVVALTVAEEAVCESKAHEFAATINGMPAPAMFLGTLGGCFQMIVGGKFYLLSHPTFHEGVEALLEGGYADGVEALELVWDSTIERFNTKNSKFSVPSSEVLAIGECCDGALAAGLPLRQMLQLSKVLAGYNKLLEDMHAKYKNNTPVNRTDAHLITNLVGQRSILESFLPDDCMICFGEQWTLTGGIPFRTDWATGWFVNAVSQMPQSKTTRKTLAPGVATDALTCLMCFQNQKNTLLNPCGHLCCQQCSKLLMLVRKPCFLCRSEIESTHTGMLN
eukprot:c6149_g1_i1.p1 GENE.c6149_g1_i1~~c6149_g1_i1.p1  ORF type:complete len:825 (-),score=222.83 c6149_g1_i1:211-2685(-)